MKNFRKFFIVFAAVFLAIFTGSCEIGLGSAVDVLAPTVEITYPPENRIIMDTFILAGKCEDDTYVDSVYVTLENASESAQVKIFNYETKLEPPVREKNSNDINKQEEKGQTWQINVNNLISDNYELPDGKWTANVYVKDSVGRVSGTVSRSFDIDNTAPSLVLSNPNTVGNASSPTTFGAIIQIKGEITEVHETSNLRFYYQKADASWNLIGTENYIDRGPVTGLSSDTPFVIARKYETGEINSSELQNLTTNYWNIYNDGIEVPRSDWTDKNVYCAFELYDNARIYTDPTKLNDVGVGTGNKSTKYTIKNHDEVVLTNGDKKVTTDSSCFLLNPDKAPRYTISTYEYTTGDEDSFTKLATGTKLNISLKAGKDNSPIKPKTVKVILQEINRDGTAKIGEDLIILLNEGDWNDTDDDVKVSKGIDVKKEKGLKQGSYYKIIVTAKDRNEIEAVAESNKEFGFLFDSSSLPPEIEISALYTAPEKTGTKYEFTNDVRISGTTLGNKVYIPVKIDTNGVKPNAYDDTLFGSIFAIYKNDSLKDEGVYVRDSSGAEVSSGDVRVIYPTAAMNLYNNNKPASSSNLVYTNTGLIEFELEIDHNNVPVAPEKYTYSFVVKLEGDISEPKKATKAVSFTVDSKLPEVKNETILPNIANGSVIDSVNGKVTFSASVVDNYELYDTAYKVCGVDENGKLHPITKYSRLFNDTNPNATDIEIDNIDTYEDFTQQGYNKIRIYVKAKDSVGNIYNDYDDNNVTATYFEYSIDQTKDTPVITPLNFSANSIFDSSRNLSLSVTDDDGIGSIEYTIDNNPKVSIEEDKLPANGKPFDIELTGLAAGTHTITVTAIDSKNETGDNAKAKMAPISFNIDDDAPTIKETTKIGSEAKVYSNNIKETSGDDVGKIKLTLDISDDWGFGDNPVTCLDTDDVNITYSTDKTKAFVIISAFPTDGTKDGDYAYTFTVTDKAGKTASLVRNICVDTQEPEYVANSAIITTAKSHTGGNWYNKTSLEVEGKAKDKNGIQKVEYSLDGGSTYKDTLPIDTSKTITANGVQTVTFGGYIPGVANGNSISLRITDNAGNVKTQSLVISAIAIDTEKPTDLELTSEAGDKLSNGSAEYTITGTAKDATSGIQKVELVLKKSDSDDVKITDIQNDATLGDKKVVWSYSDYPSTEGDLYVRVTDNADNVAEKYLFKIETDTNKPFAEIKEIKYRKSEVLLKKGTGSDSDKYVDANKIIVFSGIASDERLESVTLQYYKTSESKWVDYKSINKTANPDADLNNWSFKVNTEESIFQSTQKFQIIATDRAGNTGNQNLEGDTATAVTKAKAEKTIVINQDSDRPVVKITNLALNGMTSANANRIKLVNQKRVNFTVSDDDGVKTVEVKVKDINTNIESAYKDVTKDGYIDIENDGPCNLTFKVTDKEDRVFEATTAGNDNSPKINGNDSSVFGNQTTTDSIVYLVVDNIGPSLKDIKYAYKKSGDQNYSEDKNSLSECIFGGDYNTLKLTLKLQDANGIKDVTLKSGTDEVSGIDVGGALNQTNDDITYTISGIKIPTNVSSKDFELTFTDYLGNSTIETFSVDIDTEAPELEVDSHIQNSVVGSNFILKGKVKDADAQTIVKYIINTSETLDSDSAAWETAKTLLNAGNDGTAYSSWRLYIDGDVNNSDGYTHELSHKKLFVSDALYGSVSGISGGVVVKKESGTLKDEKYTTVQPVYFHFLTTDGAGNKDVTSFKLRFDPQGDIPTVSVTYPTNNKTLAGRIRVQGTASVYQNNNIAGIYMQIDPKVASSTDTPDFTAWKGTDTNTVPDIKTTDDTTSLSTILASENPIEYIFSRCEADYPKNVEASYQNIYGIYVGNKATWDIVINTNDEFNLNDSDGKAINNYIAIKMYVVDNYGNVNIFEGNSNDYTRVTIDADAPTIGSQQEFELWQYAWVNSDLTPSVIYTNTPEPDSDTETYTDSGCRTEDSKVTATDATTITTANGIYTKDFKYKAYKKNMWLKGEWWVTGSVSDSSGISQVDITIGNNTTQLVGKNVQTVDNATKIAKTYNYSGTESDVSNYLISFRVGVQDNGENDTAGELSYKVFIQEAGPTKTTAEDTFYINYDNKAPVSNDVNIRDNTITNNYGFFEVTSTAEEKGTQSGFARTVVYFTRDTEKSVTTIYDPYIRAKKTGNEQSYASLHFEDGLYWISKTVSSNSSKIITINSLSNNIHKGSLVKLNGAYYKVEAVTETSVTLDSNPGTVVANTPIYFAMGIVIDVESEANGSTFSTNDKGYGYYNDVSDNDDYMIESAITNNGVTEWKGNINSNNIPDGPITVNYVVFDNAGNHSAVKSTTGVKVANNALRLTGVKVWCDFNGNNVPDEDKNEVISYYNNSTDVKINGVMTKRAGAFTNNLDASETKLLTVKDVTYIYPEYIGGNGNIYVKKTYNNNVQTVPDTTDNYAKSPFVGQDGSTTEYFGIDQEKDEAGYYRKDEQGGGVGYYQGYSGYKADGTAKTTDQKFTLSLEDLGADSADNTFKVFQFDLKDSTDGTPNEATLKIGLEVKCSDTETPTVAIGKFAYDATRTTENSRKQWRDNNGVPYSHVKDMSLSEGHVECESDWKTTAKYASAKTEGKALSDDSKKWSDTDSSNVGKGSQYDYDPKISGKVTLRGKVSDNQRISEIWIQPINANSYTKVAEFNSGSVQVQTAGTSLGFAIESESNDENGHIIYWKYTFDSSSVNDKKVAIDALFKIKAKDARNSGYIEATYCMDVVPYINTVSTSLDTNNSSNPSVYSRTALGHYPLYAVTKGFNNGSKVSADDASAKLTGFNISEVTFTVTDDTESGLYTPKVEYETGKYIYCLNNDNSNAVYNMVPNGKNNNILTDDIFFDIWDINSKAAVGYKKEAVDFPVMKVNSSNSLIGFAFTNGGERFSMSNTDNSYEKWNRSYDIMSFNELNFDKNGFANAVSVGGDIHYEYGIADAYSFMSSKWGIVGDEQESNPRVQSDSITDNHIRLDSIGYNTNGSEYEYEWGTRRPKETNCNKKKERFQSQSISSYVNETGTYVYLAYYDEILNEVRFKGGIRPDSVANFQNFEEVGARSRSYEQASNVQIIANGNGDNTLGKAGQYVSIAATKNNRVVLVWWDGSALKYTYTTKEMIFKGTEKRSGRDDKILDKWIYPKGEVKNTTDVNDKPETNWTWTDDTIKNLGNRWHDAITISDMPGINCKVIVDDNDGVHIAAYDDSGKLKYAYVSNYAVTSDTFSKCTVDSFNDVGQNLTLDVAKVGNYRIPFIGYWDFTLDLPRYAYLVKAENFQANNPSDTTLDGYGTNGYTGVWDCTLIPTSSTPIKNTVSVGVWKKDMEGNGIGSINDSKVENAVKYKDSIADEDSGTCYGNGSSNAVLGYLIDADSTTYIETAQKR